MEGAVAAVLLIPVEEEPVHVPAAHVEDHAQRQRRQGIENFGRSRPEPAERGQHRLGHEQGA